MRELKLRIVAVMTVAVALSVVAAEGAAQSVERSTAIASSDVLSQIPIFNYYAGRKSDLRLRPTPLLATGEGKVRVKYQDGNAQISVKVKHLPAPTIFGPYTTYVLWALTPDGRAANLGVLAGAAGGSGSIQTQHGSSQFALIVTAEPHFAVSVPSRMIVLYNVADGVKGNESRVTLLTARADYSALRPIAIDARTRPTEIVQAEYAVAIARAAGAARYAVRPYAKAKDDLAAAQAALRSRKRSERKNAPDLARAAVIAGEDARRAAMVAGAAARAESSRRAAAAAAAAKAEKAADAAAKRAAEVAAAAAKEKAAEAARADLLNRLNSVLPTHESDRGLVSEIGGVQFAAGAAALSPAARESLAKFSGIVASYPTLEFVVEGHTDNTGSDAKNRALSLQRAISVRDYLIAQGVAASHINAAGFGSSRPIADNATAEGRARNRRVDIVIAGGVPGTTRVSGFAASQRRAP